MRISDRRSDVCSSDLVSGGGAQVLGDRDDVRPGVAEILQRLHDLLGLFSHPQAAVGFRDESRVPRQDRKSAGEGTGVSVRGDQGGRRLMKKKAQTINVKRLTEQKTNIDTDGHQ